MLAAADAPRTTSGATPEPSAPADLDPGGICPGLPRACGCRRARGCRQRGGGTRRRTSPPVPARTSLVSHRIHGGLVHAADCGERRGGLRRRRGGRVPALHRARGSPAPGTARAPVRALRCQLEPPRVMCRAGDRLLPVVRAGASRGVGDGGEPRTPPARFAVWSRLATPPSLRAPGNHQSPPVPGVRQTTAPDAAPTRSGRGHGAGRGALVAHMAPAIRRAGRAMDIGRRVAGSP